MSKPLIIGTLVAVVGLFALVGFLLWQSVSNLVTHTPAPPPQAETEEFDTSTWQTYRNDEFGFEFQYPSSLEIGTEEGEEVLGFTCFNLELTSVGQAVDYQNFAIHIDCPGRGLGERNPDEYNIDGRKVNSYNFEYENVDYKDILVVLSVDEHTYNFTSNKVSDQRDEALFQEILSTFRFLEKVNSIREIDFVSHFSSVAPYSECDEFAPSVSAVSVNNVEYFDVTNDGGGEAVVIASSCYTGTAGPDIVGVYALNSAGEVEVLQFNEGLQSSLIRWNPNRKILIGFAGIHEASDANCCPSKEKIVEYKWNSEIEQFVIVSVEVRDRVYRNKAFWDDDCYINETPACFVE